MHSFLVDVWQNVCLMQILISDSRTYLFNALLKYTHQLIWYTKLLFLENCCFNIKNKSRSIKYLNSWVAVKIGMTIIIRRKMNETRKKSQASVNRESRRVRACRAMKDSKSKNARARGPWFCYNK